MVFYEETGADLEWESERRGTRRLSSILGIFLSGPVCVYLELYCGEVISLGFHGSFFLVSFGFSFCGFTFRGGAGVRFRIPLIYGAALFS